MPCLVRNSSKKQRYPKDRGYAWIVCFANFAIMVILMGNVRSFGVFLVELKREFNATAAMISTMLSVEYMANCITAFVVLNCLSSICSSRILVMVGSLLCCICFILDSCATSVIMLPFFHILNGAGISFMFGPTMVIIGFYFEKYRGTANALCSCGTSFGQFAVSPLFSLMVTHYGIKGALLINSGLFLQCLVFAMLLRPIGFFKRILDAEQEECGSNSSLEIKIKEADDLEIEKKSSEGDASKRESLSNEPVVNSETTDTSMLTDETNENREDATEQNKCLNGLDDTIPDNKDIPDIQFSEENEENDSDKVTVELLDEKSTDKLPLCKKLFANVSLDLFKQKIFVIVFLGSTIAMVTTSVPEIYFPSYSEDIGLGITRGAYFVSLAGFGDLGSRLVTTLLADWKHLNRTGFLGVSLVIHGVVALFIPFFTTFISFSCYCVLYGVSGGIFFALSTTILTDSIGIDKLSQGLGLVFLFVGIAATGIFPLYGYIRDITGSYHVVFIINAVGLITSGILFLGATCYTKRQLKKQPE